MQTVDVPVIFPAAAMPVVIAIAKFAEAGPLPHEFVPLTVKLPAVAPDEKLAVMEAVLPDGVNPVPV